jgi:hypothetical protein
MFLPKVSSEATFCFYLLAIVNSLIHIFNTRMKILSRAMIALLNSPHKASVSINILSSQKIIPMCGLTTLEELFYTHYTPFIIIVLYHLPNPLLFSNPYPTSLP